MSSGLPRKLQSKITVQQAGLETLVYDQSRHQAFCLNPTSSAVWNACDGTRGIAQLAVTASSSVDLPVSEEVVLLALGMLRQNGLLEPESEPGSVLAAPRVVSRRGMLQSLGVGSAVLVPAVAMIVAPRAAQAYNGCADCSSTAPAGPAPDSGTTPRLRTAP